MAFAFIENGSISAYPIGTAEIQRKFPNTSFSLPLEGQDLSEFGVVEVNATPQPSFDFKSQRIEEAVPVFNQGEWTQAWNVIDLSDEEKQQIEDGQAGSVRVERNARLANCDWTQLPDAPVDKAAWASYRQQLRDISNQEGFPWTIIWPDRP